MQILLEKYKKHPNIQRFVDLINSQTQVQLKNAITSARSFFISAAYEKTEKPYIIVLSDKEEAAYLFNDLQSILSEDKLFFFPATLRHLSHNSGVKTDKAAIMMRTETMTKIRKTSNPIIVTYPAAIAETVISKEDIPNNTIELSIGEEIETGFFIEMLQDFGFVKTEFVFEPGQYAIRGGIVDVFSYSADLPYRIDFFGEEIESIRIFDIETQLSVKKVDNISIVNNIQIKTNEKRTSFLNFIDNKSIIFTDDFNYLTEKISQLYNDEKEVKLLNDETDNEETIEYTNSQEFTKKITKFNLVHLSNKTLNEKIPFIKFNITPQPRIQKNFNLLASDLKMKNEKNFSVYILSKSQKQLQRLKDILQSNEVATKTDFTPLQGIIHEGFTDNDLFITSYTDHQIFDRFHRFFLRSFNTNKSKEAQLLKEIKELNIGDYIVHIDYGVGVFKGLTTIENNGKPQEVIRIEYKDSDNLFVSIHALHKISKFKSQDAEPPRVHKLGTAVWKNLKKKTKNRIKDIAKDLIELYAKRMQEKGFAFSHDTYLQEALEASFIYEETPDQLTAIADIKKDMEEASPMDRLVCGDVGFGKTEIAIRAAFKAVTDGKQVALLCPTTILTYQHFKTFTNRLSDLPVSVDYISRMRTSKQQKEILKKLEEGTLDIVIGTHRLVSKDVKFKDLGLLVIDEEQKFGVTVKEKLKQLRVNVDSLTLTATPIPRTLQFSLMGARDLSILHTPPPNRQPIITELHTFDAEMIRKAINYEVRRGGQVFFVHNHVATLPKIKKYINEIIPDVSVEIAHGQMNANIIEGAITGFMNGDFDILLTTSIVENGLDIPNANTIIINNAHKFGLSDLHQLRGRVGRAARKAFCYLIAPPKTVLKDIARRRLNAIENFVELGSGFNIALQDLDIRGAGDLLGAEQSGYINDIGYETFKRILEETMLELRTTEYKHIFAQEDQQKEKNNNQKLIFVNDCQINTDLNIGFSNNFIKDDAERLRLYRELDNISNNEKLVEFENQLIDRFGTIPQAAHELINVVKLRQKAMTLGIEKIIMKNGAFINYFITDQNSAFYDSNIFKEKILNFVTKNPNICEMKQKNEKLLLRFNKIKTVKRAVEILEAI
ncbi:MAG: transcription-repair coupling factor [Bacteroidales bacterium]|nr:transcription-repair coupling factor [Bacteroidales bacterium]